MTIAELTTPAEEEAITAVGVHMVDPFWTGAAVLKVG